MSHRRARVLLAGVVFAVLLAQVLLYPGIDLLLPMLAPGAAESASMWFLAAEFAAFVVFAPVWGALSDRTGRRLPFVVVGALGAAAGYALLAAVPRFGGASLAVVLALRVAQGAATIGAFSLAMTMLVDLDGGHGRNMGAAGIAIGLGTAMGAPLGGQLYEVDPIAPLYAASALLFVVGLGAAFVGDRAPAPGERRIAAALATVRDTPTLLIPFAFGFIDRLTAGFFAYVGRDYFREAFALSPGDTGLMLALFFAPFALFQYPFGVLSDRVGRTGPIVAGSALYGVAVVAVGFAPTVALAGAGMVLVGVIGALMAPATMALVSDLAGGDERGVAIAGFNAVGSVGFLAGIVVGGTVAAAAGFDAAFLVAGGVEIALAAVTLPFFLRLGLGRVAASSP
ncbi:MAG: MFS transporter [Halobacteriaceae archaeon]